MSMTPEEMCRSCRHEAYCMAAYQKASTFKREKETTTTTNRETITTERWGKNGSMNINSIHFTVDISKIKDLPLLYKLIDELKDAQNRTDVPVYA